ncbi:DUF4214 domain-containing protein [Roseovarius dicentrarchi]|uniref:DUF4214 domain-containing protein n=1 Tax=Roseovarius dicentrarchi TaxID=2250573 RepID=UPI0013966771|nr:DUF4214 domain-containing protein [Roseovarius dicentrarchi]
MTDGNGHVALVQPGGRTSVTVTLQAPQTVRNNQVGSFSDGTPFAETMTGLNADPEAVGLSSITLSHITIGNGPGQLPFTPDGFHVPAVAATYMPNGNLAVVWTGVTGGNVTVPEFSVFAQILSPEGIILSDVTLIADQNVQGSSLAPPFVSAGADNKLFIGWTGTTDRNGAGTNEIMGGVFDVPTYAKGGDTPSGTLATDGDDTVVGPAPVDFVPVPKLYLLDGDDVWIQGAATSIQGVYGMNGDDRFALNDAASLASMPLYAGLGYDTLDLSGSTTALNMYIQPIVDFRERAGSQNRFEAIIGTSLDDTVTAPGFVNVPANPDDPLPKAPLLHTEGGDDTIRFNIGNGGTVDGGSGYDIMTTSQTRDKYELTFHGDHYKLSSFFTDYYNPEPTIRERDTMILRSIEEIRFGDETVKLQATASLPSGGLGDSGGVVEPPAIDPDMRLFGTAMVKDTLTGGTGNDWIFGDGAAAVYYGAGVANQVYRLYQATLDRMPDVAGHAAWSGRIASGEKTLMEVTQGFVGSPEFQNTYKDLSDSEFVTLLYDNVLDSTPDAQGLARWTGELAAGVSRAQVVVGFAESPQFVAETTAAANGFAARSLSTTWSDEVFRLYQASFDNAPDVMGQTNWAGRLARGEKTLLEVAEGFVGSPQFQNTYKNLSDSEFVTLLYDNVLDSTPDANGLARWTGELAAGVSRAQVLLGFSESPQFNTETRGPLKDWMRAQGVDDTITPGAGNNVVAGGQFADAFVFSASDDGATVVRDLEAWDFIELRNFGYTGAGQARAEMSQVGNSVVFDDQGVQITFENTLLGQITDDMILV